MVATSVYFALDAKARMRCSILALIASHQCLLLVPQDLGYVTFLWDSRQDWITSEGGSSIAII